MNKIPIKALANNYLEEKINDPENSGDFTGLGNALVSTNEDGKT